MVRASLQAFVLNGWASQTSIDFAMWSADVTHILSDLELIIHRVKVCTTPDGKVVDLFFITDGM
jgi:UTP:GlnB (protein PII) uridylyltransferase